MSHVLIKNILTMMTNKKIIDVFGSSSLYFFIVARESMITVYGMSFL